MSRLQDIAAANLKDQEPPAPPSGREFGREAFRNRTLSRLQGEAGAKRPTEPASPNEAGAAGHSAARQAEEAGYTAAELEMLEGYPDDEAAVLHPEADAGQPETGEQPEAGAQADEDASEAAAEDADAEETQSEPEEGSVAWWQGQAEKAEEARHNMERDYRQKTHKIGTMTRELEQSMSQAVAENAFYVGRAEQAIQQQFGNVNWQALQSDPEKYQQMTAQYQRAIQIRDQAAARQQAIHGQLNERMNALKDQEAELSRSILKTSVPGWNNQRVLQLREFAEKEGLYSGDEFDNITDWQRMLMLDAMEKMRTASTEIKVPRKRRGRKPAAGANKGQAPLRNAQGQFQNSRQAMWENPGDPRARRGFFMDKLAAERAGGRR